MCGARQADPYTATGLPVIIAITTIGVSSGIMTAQNAAALVGAGVLTVLFFPLAAAGHSGVSAPRMWRLCRREPHAEDRRTVNGRVAEP